MVSTFIFSAFSVSSAVLSDRIYVIGSGRIVEEGTHAELMAKGGNYAEMFTLQASRYKGGEVDEIE